MVIFDTPLKQFACCGRVIIVLHLVCEVVQYFYEVLFTCYVVLS